MGITLLFSAWETPWWVYTSLYAPCVPWVGVHPGIYASLYTLGRVPPLYTLCTPSPRTHYGLSLYTVRVWECAVLAGGSRRLGTPVRKRLEEAKNHYSERFERFTRGL